MLYLTADLHINHKLMARIRGFGDDVQEKIGRASCRERV